MLIINSAKVSKSELIISHLYEPEAQISDCYVFSSLAVDDAIDSRSPYMVISGTQLQLWPQTTTLPAF